ncbi:MAG: hypothetical protein H5U04_03680 [Firmicutes bacterium]|nr:hypothetical protein [Bacillota bacterium]
MRRRFAPIRMPSYSVPEKKEVEEVETKSPGPGHWWHWLIILAVFTIAVLAVWWV